MIVNLGVVICLLISYLSVYIAPDKFWIPSLFGLAYPYFLVANLFFIVFWILFKPKYSILSAFIVVIGFSFLNRYVQFSGKTESEANVKLLSYNVKHFTGVGAVSLKDNADSIKILLERIKPDIICLQEVKLRTNKVFNIQQLLDEFEFVKHYQYARTSSTGGSVTMTRFPIVNMQEIRFEGSGNMAIYTDIVIQGDTVRVFNIHLQSYRIDPKNYSIIESSTFTEEEGLNEVKAMGSKFKRAFQMRAKQARNIRKCINESPYSVIVCGDFNDTPVSYSYQKVKGKLVDAFVKSGKGISRTYIGDLPSFRIDYIMHSKNFDSYNFVSIPVNYSDHLPITCDILFNE